MGSNNCEKCGKELNFFSRKGGLKNERLDIHYDSLCGDCYQKIKNGIAAIDSMYQFMLEKLKDRQEDNMAAVDIDTLIFLGIEAVYRTVPNFEDESCDLHQTFINRRERIGDPVNEMAAIVENIIDYGFALNKKSAQIIDFKSYFLRTTLYTAPIGMNCNALVPQSYCSVFMTCRGLVAKHLETGELFTATLQENQEIKFTLSLNNNQTDIIFENFAFDSTPDKNIILSGTENDVITEIVKTIKRFNLVAGRRIERNKRNLQTAVTESLYKDLKKLQPGCPKRELPLEFVLIFLMKNIKEDVQGRHLNEQGITELTISVLQESFSENLADNHLSESKQITDYISDHSYLVENIKATHKNKIGEKAWAFFTTKGYIVNFLTSKQTLFMYDNHYPNDLYYPCNDMIYKGQRFIQIPEKESAENADSDFRTLDGLIIYSENIEKIRKAAQFFRFNNTFYIMDRYVETKSEIYQSREKLIEVKRIADQLFNDFSYLPFCQYDEWTAICDKIKEDDLLLSQLIDEKAGRKPHRSSGNTTYTLRIINTFTRLAKELNGSLKLNDLSIAKALLWDFFNDALVDVMAGEWIRLVDDFVTENDSPESAFEKYFNLADIETDKSYYLGLFVYYLMNKAVLPLSDFLSNYEKCLPIYTECNQRITAELRAKKEAENAKREQQKAELLKEKADAEAAEAEKESVSESTEKETEEEKTSDAEEVLEADTDTVINDPVSEYEQIGIENLIRAESSNEASQTEK